MPGKLTFGSAVMYYDTLLDSSGIFVTPSKDVEFISVPGRNGDLSFDNDRMNNLEIKVRMFTKNTSTFYLDVKSLYQQQGYNELFFSEQSDHYRVAQFVSSTQLETLPFNEGGQFEITFNCKPQRYFKVGDNWIEISSGYSEFSNSMGIDLPMLPLFEVRGNGTLTITPGLSGHETQSFTVTGNGVNAILIDSELQDCYFGDGTNANSYVTFTNGFPYLNKILCTVTYTGFTKVRYKPRYWTI